MPEVEGWWGSAGSGEETLVAAIVCRRWRSELASLYSTDQTEEEKNKGTLNFA